MGRLILHDYSRSDPRLALHGRPSDYKSYRIDFGRDLVMKGSCEVVGCEAWRKGWQTVCDERTDLGTAQAAYIRQKSGRTFKEYHTDEGLTVFRFESGQRCFAAHQIRPETFTVRLGDNRVSYGLVRRHKNGRDWAEDCGEHQQAIAERIRKYHG